MKYTIACFSSSIGFFRTKPLFIPDIFITLFSRETILCQAGADSKLDKELVKTYCWIEGGFIDRNQLNGTLVKQVIHRGVASKLEKEDVSKISLKHYQWIPILILMQAVVFMGPKLLWNMLEGGRMERIIKEIGE